MPVTKAKKTTKGTKAPPPRMTFAEAMRELEKAGSAQTKKTYARHGAKEPMFGVSFAMSELAGRLRRQAPGSAAPS